MNVLYIRTSNIYDDSRATKEIITLAKKGHRVYVAGWDRDGRAKKRCEEIFSSYGNLIEIDFYSCYIDGGIGIRNIDKLIKWFLWIKRQIKKHNDINVVHACNLDAAFGVWKYAKRKGIKIVYDIYDYYIDSHSVPHFLEGIIEKSEIKVINKSSATIICTEERREQISKARPVRIVVIHNSPDVSTVVKSENVFDYAYCGALFGQRLLKETFNEYPNHREMKFAIAGYGEFAGIAKELSDAYQNFEYFGSVSYDEVLQIERESKVISAIYEPSIRNHRLCAPNKFYEALALAKPVIVCRGTGIDKIVEANNIGIVIDYDPIQFFETLDRLANDPVMCEKMGNNARHLYEMEYKWEIMQERLLKIYDEIN